MQLGWSRRWIAQKAPTIPGFRVLGNTFVFPKSVALNDWMDLQQKRKSASRPFVFGDARFARPLFDDVLAALQRFHRIALRELNRTPFNEWPENYKQLFSE